jgi:excinuclease ABC subunit C
MTGKLSEKLSRIPTAPGVYLFRNARGKVIYIGKAKNLRNRVRSYFQRGRAEGPKLYVLVSKIADVEWIVTDSEKEALILEANLVKEYKPRYNVTLKDDKSFPYIRVTNEEFPRIFPTRRIVKDGSRYFGPYTDVHNMRDLLKTVRKIFPIRSCNYRLDAKTIESKKVRLCLDYYIQRCPGPCEGKISQEEYARMVEHVVGFIEGKDSRVIAELQESMYRAAERQEFEKAARIRDQLRAIEVFRSRQKVVSTEEIDRDIVGIACEAEDACGLIFKVRDGKIVGRYHFYLNRLMDQSDEEVLQSFLQQYYVKVDFVPDEVFVPIPLADLADFEAWLTQKRGTAVRFVVPQEGEDAKLVRLANRNARLLLDELKLQKAKEKEEREARLHPAVEALQKVLALPKPPKRIEAFDISNLHGTDAVASMVCFVNGRPHKSDYRRFKIRSVEGIDDFAMMREVVGRRYRRVLEEKGEMPDLILIDGGKGQLSSALQALSELGIQDQPVIALAKRLDEIYLPEFPDPQNIPKDSPALRLLQRIRDESHRFAINYHRKLREKRHLASELDEIPGIGPARRRLLLQHFGSLEKIRRANLDDLCAVPGLPKNIARSIYAHFHPDMDHEKISETSSKGMEETVGKERGP